MSIGFLQRSDPFSNVPRYRTRYNGTPEYQGLSSLETRTVYKGALASGATTLYALPLRKRARISGGLCVIHNPTGAAIAADLHIVPAGAAAGAANKIAALSVASLATSFALPVGIWQTMLSGDALVINTGAADLNAWVTLNEDREGICAFLGGFVGNLGTADTTVLTVPALRTAALRSLVVFNPTGGALTVTWNVRPAGVAAGAANQIAVQSVAAGAQWTLDLSHLPAVGQGGIVSARGSAAGLNVWTNAVLI